VIQPVDKMIGAEELAELLGMNPNTVKEMAMSGEIPSYRRPGRTSPYRFIFEEVKKAMTSKPKSRRTSK
jgi:excisionase family DNA binding protein